VTERDDLDNIHTHLIFGPEKYKQVRVDPREGVDPEIAMVRKSLHRTALGIMQRFLMRLKCAFCRRHFVRLRTVSVLSSVDRVVKRLYSGSRRCYPQFGGTQDLCRCRRGSIPRQFHG
jgi:hypothetical protein